MKKGLFTKWLPKFNIDIILKLIKEGRNIKEISKIIGIPNRRLGEMLKFYNININKQYSIHKNHDYFDIIDTEEKAYILGYTIADGCVSIEPKKRNNVIYSSSKRLSYIVSIDDREIIEKIRTEISPTTKIKEFHNTKGAVNRKLQISLRISSNKIVDDLIKLNVIPNKTYNSNFKFNFNNIEHTLIRHLIRGFMDGDGHVAKSDLSFVSTSKIFLEQIVEFFKNEIPDIKYRFYKNNGKTIDYYKLYINLGFEKRKQIYNLLYENSTIFLKRKKLKFNIENTVLI